MLEEKENITEETTAEPTEGSTIFFVLPPLSFTEYKNKKVKKNLYYKKMIILWGLFFSILILVWWYYSSLQEIVTEEFNAEKREEQ